MSETTDKPKLGARAPLGLKRTVETGKVKQSFSHGRSNTVVVEVKKRRILGPGGGAPAEAVPVPVPEAPKPAPAPVQSAPKPAAPQRPVNDQATRRELQEKLLREADEARLASLEEARRREDRQAQQATEEERPHAKKKTPAKEGAGQRAEQEAVEVASPAEPAPAAAAPAVPAADEDE